MYQLRSWIVLGGFLLVVTLQSLLAQAIDREIAEVLRHKDEVPAINFCFDENAPKLGSCQNLYGPYQGRQFGSNNMADRKRWIIVKSKNTILYKYIMELLIILAEDNVASKPPPYSNGSRIVMEFEFEFSKLAKAVSVDATARAVYEIEDTLSKKEGEFVIEAPIFTHPDQVFLDSGKVINDYNIHPKPFEHNKYFDEYDTITLKECGVKAEHPALEKDDWGIRAVLNVGTGFQKKVPKVPISREFHTRVFVIGQGIDLQAKNSIELENTFISNGYKVVEERYATINMSQTRIGNYGLATSNLGTYQAQVIASISKRTELIPIVLTNPGKHTGDTILRAFEAVFELAKKTSTHKKTLVTFSGKVISFSKHDSFIFTEFIGKLLHESNIVMTYGLDEKVEHHNIESAMIQNEKPERYKRYFHLGWYPYVLSVMAFNRDMRPTAQQEKIYTELSKVHGYKLIFAPGANVYVPYISTKTEHRMYKGKYCYVDNSIGAATAIAVQSMYLSSLAFRYAKDPSFIHDVTVKRSLTRVSKNHTALNLLADFCTIIDTYQFSKLDGKYKCVPRYETMQS